jgi:hypothetical protein
MKKLMLPISLMVFILGMTLPSIGSNKGNSIEKAKIPIVNPVKNTNDNMAPPPSWTVPIRILDASIDCPAKSCHWLIAAYPATSDCHAQSANLITSTPFNNGTALYTLSIPSTYSYVIIRIIPDPGYPACGILPNSNYCCEIVGQVTLCNLKICP